MKDCFVDCFVHIDLGHELCSEHTLSAVQIRHQIEIELGNLGYKLCGAGIGFGGMDIDLCIPAKDEESARQTIEAIIKKYGLPKFTIDFKSIEE